MFIFPSLLNNNGDADENLQLKLGDVSNVLLTAVLLLNWSTELRISLYF